MGGMETGKVLVGFMPGERDNFGDVAVGTKDADGDAEGFT